MVDFIGCLRYNKKGCIFAYKQNIVSLYVQKKGYFSEILCRRNEGTASA